MESVTTICNNLLQKQFWTAMYNSDLMASVIRLCKSSRLNALNQLIILTIPTIPTIPIIVVKRA